MESATPDHKSARTPVVLTVALTVVAFILTSAIIAMFSFHEIATGGRQNTAPLADYGAVPHFRMVERSGKTIALDDLRGSIWIADFIFTYCAGPCPLMTMHMRELQDALAASQSVRLVSFTVDPERDTPEVMSAYADQYGADRERWWFLRGEVADVANLAVDGFHVGSRDDPVLHSTLFALVDRRGHIRAYYHSDDVDLVKKVTDDVAILIRDKRV